MKTPNRIILIRGEREKYNPEKDIYESQGRSTKSVPCLVNKVSQSKVFELYGNRTDVIIFENAIYEPIEAIDAPIKGTVRLKKVGPNGI